jgi:hypothetical protein
LIKVNFSAIENISHMQMLPAEMLNDKIFIERMVFYGRMFPERDLKKLAVCRRNKKGTM